MDQSKAKSYARQLSDLPGVSAAQPMYVYSRGVYAVWVDCDMSGRVVLLVDEESVVMWKHNHARWQQENKQDGTNEEDYGQA